MSGFPSRIFRDGMSFESSASTSSTTPASSLADYIETQLLVSMLTLQEFSPKNLINHTDLSLHISTIFSKRFIALPAQSVPL